MSSAVLDASAGVELALGTGVGGDLSRYVSGRELWVPDVFYVEVAGVLRRMELHDEVSADRASLALGRLLALRARRVDAKPLIEDAWRLRHNVTIADGIYVSLARRLDAALITGDSRLARAPAAVLGNIELVAPP